MPIHKAERRKYLKRRYKRMGTSLEAYEALLEAQGGVCAICGKPPDKTRLAWDHDHWTGELRGLLCNGCNRYLGWVENNLPALVAYLKKYRPKMIK